MRRRSPIWASLATLKRRQQNSGCRCSNRLRRWRGPFSSGSWTDSTLCAARTNSGVLSWSALRSHADGLQVLVIAIGLAWSIAFLVIALHYELQLYADGAMFSYAVAVQDVWAFHWHNISARASVFVLTLLPAEIYVGLTSNPFNGIKVYGFLLYAAPLFSLICTFGADRSRAHITFTYACISNALLCPLKVTLPKETLVRSATYLSRV